MPYYVRQSIGPNNLSMPEDEVIDLIIPLTSPQLNEFHLTETGERIDKDGRKLCVRQWALDDAHD